MTVEELRVHVKRSPEVVEPFGRGKAAKENDTSRVFVSGLGL